MHHSCVAVCMLVCVRLHLYCVYPCRYQFWLQEASVRFSVCRARVSSQNTKLPEIQPKPSGSLFVLHRNSPTPVTGESPISPSIKTIKTTRHARGIITEGVVSHITQRVKYG